MANVLDSSIKEYEQAERTILGEKITVKQLADMAPMPKPKIVLDEEALYDIWTQPGEYEGFWWHDEDRIANITGYTIKNMLLERENKELNEIVLEGD